MAPFLVVYALFTLAPVLQAIYLSGFNWDLLGAEPQFVGLANFARMFGGTDIVWSLDYVWLTRLVVVLSGATIAYVLWARRASRVAGVLAGAAAVVLALLLGLHPGPHGTWRDPTFWNSLHNTIEFTLISTPILVALPLCIALLLHNKRTGVNAYRAVFFLPYVLPISAVTLIWSYLLNPDRGLIAGFLAWFGAKGISFLSDPNLAMPAVIATTVWWSFGFNMVLFIAGLQDIEPNLYEAASLDGAGYWRRFLHVTLPGLRHATVLVAVTQLIASFQIFGQVYIMTRGGPGSATEVFIQHIYETGFKSYRLGYAAALSLFLFIIMAGVSAIQFRLITRDT